MAAASTVWSKFGEHMYKPDGEGDKAMLEKRRLADGAVVTRLVPLYFHPVMYGLSTLNTATPPPTIDGTTVAPFYGDTISKSVREKLLAEIIIQDATKSVDPSKFANTEALVAWFDTILLKACRAAALKKANASDVNFTNTPALFFRKYLLNPDSTDETVKTTVDNIKAAYAAPDAMRPYIAWKSIETELPKDERDGFFLVERVYTLAVAVFVMQSLNPAATVLDSSTNKSAPISSTPAKLQKSLSVGEHVIMLLVRGTLAQTAIADPNVPGSIDKLTRSNVEISRDIHSNSERLIENKNVVQKTQDNLRSLVSIDTFVQRQRKTALICMIGLIVLAALVVAGLGFAFYLGRNGEMYLLALLVTLAVVIFEAFRGAERLFALPASVYK